MKVFPLLLLSVIWTSAASVISRSTVKVSPAILDDNSNVNTNASKHLYRRAARTKCSPPVNPALQRRRALPEQSPNNATLWRRMQLPGQGAAALETYMMAETDNAEGFVWDVRTNDPEQPLGDANTSLFHDFSQERSLAAIRLKGCTGLVIISRRGVYLGHYWENISFDPDPEFLENGLTDADIFESTVLDGLRYGVRDPKDAGLPQQQSVKRFADEVVKDDPHVKAYLIRPDLSWQQNNMNENPSADDAGYPQKWRLMREEIEKFLPAIKAPGGWNEHIYTPTVEATLATTSRGRMLFKFDPEHVPAAKRRDKPTRLAVLWSEQQLLHEDSWKDL